jgi:hypothetical protein
MYWAGVSAASPFAVIARSLPANRALYSGVACSCRMIASEPRPWRMRSLSCRTASPAPLLSWDWMICARGLLVGVERCGHWPPMNPQSLPTWAAWSRRRSWPGRSCRSAGRLERAGTATAAGRRRPVRVRLVSAFWMYGSLSVMLGLGTPASGHGRDVRVGDVAHRHARVDLVGQRRVGRPSPAPHQVLEAVEGVAPGLDLVDPAVQKWRRCRARRSSARPVVMWSELGGLAEVGRARVAAAIVL